MATIPQIRVGTGDLRRLAKELGTTTKAIKPLARRIMRQEAKVSAKLLKDRVTAAGTTDFTVKRRTGALGRAVGYEVFETDFTVKTDFGFISTGALDPETLAAARVHSGSVEGEVTTIKPRSAPFLAFPGYEGDDLPIKLRDSRGQQLMTASQARKKYQAIDYQTYLYPANNPRMILARKKSKKKSGRKLAKGSFGEAPATNGPFNDESGRALFLFHVRKSVTIPQRIDLVQISSEMVERVVARLRSEARV